MIAQSNKLESELLDAENQYFKVQLLFVVAALLTIAIVTFIKIIIVRHNRNTNH